MNKIYRGKNGLFATKAEKLAMIAAETATVAATAPAPIEEVIVYKGFSKRADDTIHCRGHVFEISKEYSVEGVPRACGRGFHGCEKLFDVFSYYPLDSSHTFGRAKLIGPLSRRDDKIAGKSIVVLEEFHLSHLINAIAKEAKEDKRKSVAVDATLASKEALMADWLITTDRYYNAAYYPMQATSEYKTLMSTVPNQKMINVFRGGRIFGGANQQHIFGAGEIISAGNNSIITGLSANTHVDVRGQHNTITLPQGGAFRGPVGTKFSITNVGMTVTGEVGKDGVEPDRWTSIQQTQRPIEYDTKLVQS